MQRINEFVNRQLQLTPSTDTLFFAHVTDLHIHQPEPYRDERFESQHFSTAKVNYPSPSFTSERFEAVIDELNALDPAPAFVMFGGDLTDYGLEGEWRQFFKLLGKLRLPFRLSLGNHDHGEGLGQLDTFLREREKHLPDSRFASAVEGDYAYSFTEKDYLFIVLDSRDKGAIADTQRQWLIELLQEVNATRPIVVCVHRPLLAVGNWVDWHSLHDRDLLRTLSAYNTRLVLSGHTHMHRAWLYRGTRHLVTPALAYGIGSDLGYRLVGLTRGAVAWSAVRYLPGPTLDQYYRWDLAGEQFETQRGQVALDVPEAFESHPLCDPFIWDHEQNPAIRQVSEGSLELSRPTREPV